MKKTALLNSSLSAVIAKMGHTDSLVICDAGLPIAVGQQTIDLALTQGIPDFLSTVKAVLSELFVEKIQLADEIKQANPHIEAELLQLIEQTGRAQGNAIAVEYLPHSQFKQNSRQARAVVRTGECSPYANVVLYSGVPF
ncbi:D-ribose pyranase [Muribacter muris]|uniref:D-ribose pyranase n=1 Tax=Muribacter muris TaxID=67855 RepID=A0A4Y9K7E1_9PAST|nr:D-ribose pyranase [Muribacter muris]MBF0784031.1 D-ribose pyranase [Muribacter muris]MBF0827526.1 D-ribose pyranase [Muribacter muris]TFV13089.1 D-ribose pyranase [Muribacter muris]